MKTGMIVLIIVVVVLIVVGGIVGYLYFSGAFNHKQGRFPNRNFQLNQSQIDDVTSFFNSNPSQADISTYCQQNRGNCMYYCRSINSQSSYCGQMMNLTRNGNYTRQGNFTRGNYSGNYSRRQGGAPPMPQQP